MDLNKEIKVVLSYEASKSKWKNNPASKEWKRANKVAIVVMGQGLQRKRNCGCIDELFIMLKTLSQKRINQKQTQMSNKFRLVDGKMISLNGTHYTNDNITDEKAIEILTKFPSHIVTFVNAPDNWKELCGKPVGGLTGNPAPTAGLAPEGANDKTTDYSPTGREAELLKMDKADLLTLATKIAIEGEGLKKPRHNTGIPKLVAFILENEPKG